MFRTWKYFLFNLVLKTVCADIVLGVQLCNLEKTLNRVIPFIKKKKKKAVIAPGGVAQ